MGHHPRREQRIRVKKNLFPKNSNNVAYSSFFHRIFLHRDFAPEPSPGPQLGVVRGTNDVVVVYPGSNDFNAVNKNFRLTLVEAIPDDY